VNEPSKLYRMLTGFDEVGAHSLTNNASMRFVFDHYGI